MEKKKFLGKGFLNSVEQFPDNNALYVEGKYYNYTELYNLAVKIAAMIQKNNNHSDSTLTAVFAYRNITAFSGVLGALLAGHGYVPLNRMFPVERTKTMLSRSECKSIIIDRESMKQIDFIIADITYPLLLIFPELEDISDLSKKWPQHNVVGKKDLENLDEWELPDIDIDNVAYLLFTSGSTGIPKGVTITHKNVYAFIDYMCDRYNITETDRLTQMFDMTFDLSVFDMFMAWEKGACVYCPSLKTLIKPGKFVSDNEITIWFSVPSTLIFMRRFKMLKHNSYPSLRLSLFCGEPLPVTSIQEWGDAAPNSIIENLYGPTELTIACTYYRWNKDHSINESHMGIVPIGYAFPHMNVLVVDDNLAEVDEGCDGELLMTGPQISRGYLKDIEKTKKAFVVAPGKNELYYRTGDRVKKPSEDSPLLYLGRVDFQIKVHGHRVELGEIEAVIREHTGTEGVVALGWPLSESGAEGVEVFIEGDSCDVEALRKQIASKVPNYMIPSKFHFLEKFPLNVNGKYDRKVLIERLKNSE